jgi:Spy/CpxP family protein refolding chaperone
MKRIPFLAISLLLIAMGAFAAGPPPRGAAGPGGPPPGGGNGAALAEYLDLTTDQKASWETVQDELRATIESFRDQQETLHEQLETALEGSDATAIGNLMLQIRAIHEQIKAAHDSAHDKFAALLTAEQKVKFDAFEAALEFLRQRGPGPGGPGGRP